MILQAATEAATKASAAMALGAAGHSIPLIDIDLTVFIQLFLFIVLFVVGNKLLFQPYLRLRELRHEGIEGARAEAERMSAEADAKLADYEKSLAAARDRANEESRVIRAEAATYEADVTGKARTTAMAAMNTAQAQGVAETEAARAQLMPQAAALARAMAEKLLGREVA